eukprot:TRINITY_DN10092_c0_g1_i1.p1 TRINITY_DN10092_c0_g1~~TRINITY_DN10092_c0_g1_i1.p1  ORF type:complete len:505 (+),score=169.21 TRINITY_DN10092_c0_g1_i1:75-1517(+)
MQPPAVLLACMGSSDARDLALKWVQCWAALAGARGSGAGEREAAAAAGRSIAEARSWLWLGRSLTFQEPAVEAWGEHRRGDARALLRVGQFLSWACFFALDNLRLLAQHGLIAGGPDGLRRRAADCLYAAHALALAADCLQLARRRSSCAAAAAARALLDFAAVHLARFPSRMPRWAAPLCGLLGASIALRGLVRREAAAVAEAGRSRQTHLPQVVWQHGRRLQGKMCLITGSSSGIGKAVALQFAREGAHVALNYPTGVQAEREHCLTLATEIEKMGRRAIICAADVSNEQQVNSMVAQVMDAFGRIDVLVNNAGIASGANVEEMSADMWDRMIAVNLRGVFLCTRAVLPIMYRFQDEPGQEHWHGKIINSSSQLAYKGAPGFSHYTATKGAILSFTRSVSLEIGKRRVRINSVGPGATMTPILDRVPQHVLDEIISQIPSGRMATVDDIAPAFVYLASDEANHLVGQCISPNGGDLFL